MASDNSEDENVELAYDLSITLTTFWGNQLERTKHRAESQMNRTPVPLECNGQIWFGTNRN